jgi:biofilm PGA synthesis lipoprotein PgaB
MAMPRMEGQKEADADGWLTKLAKRAAATPKGLDGTLFELQARDWRTSKPVSDAELSRQLLLLQRQGVRHVGYYPDDFLNDQPSLKTLQRTLSMRSLLKRKLPDTSSPQITPPQVARLSAANSERPAETKARP